MTDTAVPTATDADRALKTKHRAMWASGDYPTLASELIWDLGPRLVAAADVRPGERVLDIAAGSGNVAIPAALRGGCRAPAPGHPGPAPSPPSPAHATAFGHDLTTAHCTTRIRPLQAGGGGPGFGRSDEPIRADRPIPRRHRPRSIEA